MCRLVSATISHEEAALKESDYKNFYKLEGLRLHVFMCRDTSVDLKEAVEGVGVVWGGSIAKQ